MSDNELEAQVRVLTDHVEELMKLNGDLRMRIAEVEKVADRLYARIGTLESKGMRVY